MPFQLTRPVWGEPLNRWYMHFDINISTHSPRVGRTNSTTDAKPFGYHFNSLAPCGANLDIRRLGPSIGTFQLTRPVWGEPPVFKASSSDLNISTHSPRVGRTALPFRAYALIWNISTHSPRVGRTELAWQRSEQSAHFNSLAPCGANPRVCLAI